MPTAGRRPGRDRARPGHRPLAADTIAQRLHDAHHRFPVRNLVYEGAGHLIVAPFWPTNLVESADEELLFGGSAAANARANADSWPRMLAFIAEFGAPGRRD